MTASIANSNTLVLLALAVLFAAEKLRLLPQRRSAVDAQAELELSTRLIDRLRNERNLARDRVTELERTRSFEPVLEQMSTLSKLQAEVIDRLAHHNGSFKEMEGSLHEIHEGLKLLTGFIAGIAEIPTKEKP